jgi:3-hydroxy-3-methylglutaryl CoA synthase
MDFAGSLRAGTNALIAGVNAVRSGAARHVLIACGETRLGAPKGDKERAFGDGAAAILVADSEVVASIETTYSVFRESHDTWRSDQDVFVRSWEDRFVREAVYSRVVSETISAALDRSSLSPGDFSKAAIYAPDPRLLSGVAGKLGFDPKSQLQDPLYQTVGNTGAALPLMMLVGTLEEAAPDDRILVAGYGDGCDVLILNVALLTISRRPRCGATGNGDLRYAA